MLFLFWSGTADAWRKRKALLARLLLLLLLSSDVGKKMRVSGCRTRERKNGKTQRKISVQRIRRGLQRNKKNNF